MIITTYLVTGRAWEPCAPAVTTETGDVVRDVEIDMVGHCRVTSTVACAEDAMRAAVEELGYHLAGAGR